MSELPSKPRKPPTTRLAEGYTRVQAQVPQQFGDGFQKAARLEGHGGAKALATVAFGLLLSLDQHERDELVRVVVYNGHPKRVGQLTPEMLGTLLRVMRESRPQSLAKIQAVKKAQSPLKAAAKTNERGAGNRDRRR